MFTYSNGNVADTPVGTIISYAGPINNIQAKGWLCCNNASYSTIQYAKLFNVIGYTYGGSGNTFNVPNLTSNFIKGRTAYSTPSKNVGGKSTYKLLDTDLPKHNHTGTATADNVDDHTHSNASNFGARYGTPYGYGSQVIGPVGTGQAHYKYTTTDDNAHSHSVTIPSVGNGNEFDCLPQYINLFYIIKW